MAAAAWFGVLAGLRWGRGALFGFLALAVLVVSFVPTRRDLVALVAFVALVGCWSGQGVSARTEAVLAFETEPGPVALDVRLRGDPRPGQFGWWALAVADPPERGRPPGVPMLVTFAQSPEGGARDRLHVVGDRSGRSGLARGDPYSGVVRVQRHGLIEKARAPWWRAGNRVRDRALERLRTGDPARALLAGFLVGDVTGVPQADMEAMRRSGLTHLVAVSGSNVALFLGLTMLAVGPLGAGPRRRAVVGLVALVVLVIATRWEPSVVRASVMAALVLLGRVGGWAFDTVTSLSVTVMLVLAVSGELATDVGFILSVLATLGVMVGTTLPRGTLPRPVATTLLATGGAQVAVAPVLLAVFGSMPLLAPVTNLVAIPVVAVTTMVGAVAVATGWEWLIELATRGAVIVLWVARLGAPWPQLGWGGFFVLCLLAVSLAWRRGRPFVVVAAAGWMAVILVGVGHPVPGPAAVVLDVGQGDSILLIGETGRMALVDGGPDPALLERKLAGYRVGALDLVVLTHVHADHAAGLEAVVGRRPVTEIWVPGPPHTSPSWKRLERLIADHSVPARAPPVGEVISLDGLTIEVLGPVRRYAAPNDQSAVLMVQASGGPRLLLTGDIEVHAQRDLGGLTAEILKVPHQGGATSDLAWLGAVGADWAIISVGPNSFGHPAPEVIESLLAAGARVSRTDQDGDIVIPLR